MVRCALWQQNCAELALKHINKKRDNGLFKLPLSLSYYPQSLISVFNDHLARRIQLREVVEFGLRDSTG